MRCGCLSTVRLASHRDVLGLTRSKRRVAHPTLYRFSAGARVRALHVEYSSVVTATVLR